MPFDPRTLVPAYQAIRAAVAVISHTAACAVVLIGIWLIEQLLHLLWGTHEPLLFDRFPIRYLFETMDGGVLVVFACAGVIAAIRAFME